MKCNIILQISLCGYRNDSQIELSIEMDSISSGKKIGQIKKMILFSLRKRNFCFIEHLKEIFGNEALHTKVFFHIEKINNSNTSISAQVYNNISTT